MENLPPLLQLKQSDYTFFDSCGSYVSGLRTYFGYFGEIACMKKLLNIQPQKAKDWIEKNLSNEFLRKHQKENFRNRKNELAWINILYVLKNNLLIDIEDDGCINILHNEQNAEQAEEILVNLKPFTKRIKRTTEIGLLVNSGGRLSVFDAKIKKPKLQVDKNYNDDLLPLHNNILEILRTNQKNGLILFYGPPGTGKSTYIRYLIHSQKKRVIFMPTSVAGILDSPSLISLLIDNQNSILVIEDAEDLLTSRDVSANSGISTLLNLTDGLLGESLGIQVICTFNTRLENIDTALLRKGRLMAMYEFKPLASDKANLLLADLKQTEQYTNMPMTLAEIFNTQQASYDFYKPRRQKIGFAKPILSNPS